MMGYTKCGYHTKMPEMNEKMTEIWINKTAKWRKSRGLPE